MIIFFSSVVRARFNKSDKEDFLKVDYSYYENETIEFGIESRILKNNVLQLRKGEKVQNIWKSFTDLDGEASLMIAGDKPLCNYMLKEAGIPVPEYVVLPRGDFFGAIRFKKNVNSDIVIKPARDTGDSKGVFIKPNSIFSIWYAVNYTGAFGREIIVEKFFQGLNYRLLFCKGRFLGASARIPASLKGDGIHSVRELIQIANIGRQKQGRYLKYTPETRPILYEIEITKDLIKLLKKQGFKINSIPEKDEIIMLQEICHWLKGGEYHDVTGIVSQKLVNICHKAVDILGVKLAGVDVIAKDIQNPEDSTFVINEVNTSPGLLVHYEVQNQQQMRPVAKEIIKSMFE